MPRLAPIVCRSPTPSLPHFALLLCTGGFKESPFRCPVRHGLVYMIQPVRPVRWLEQTPEPPPPGRRSSRLWTATAGSLCIKTQSQPLRRGWSFSGALPVHRCDETQHFCSSRVCLARHNLPGQPVGVEARPEDHVPRHTSGALRVRKAGLAFQPYTDRRTRVDRMSSSSRSKTNQNLGQPRKRRVMA